MRVPDGVRLCAGLLVFSGLSACSVLSRYVQHADPLTAEEHLRLGASYEAQGLKSPAAQQYEASLRLRENHVPALVALGNLSFNSGDLKEAEARYRQVLRQDPGHVGANNNLAMIYQSEGHDLREAEQFALVALKHEGAFRPYVLDTLAGIYIQQERYGEARKSLDEADQITPPDNPALHAQLAATRNKLQP